MGHFYSDEYHIQILIEELEAEIEANGKAIDFKELSAYDVREWMYKNEASQFSKETYNANPLHEREYDQKEIDAMKDTLAKLKESYKYAAALSKLLDGDINFEDYKNRVK